MKKNKFKKIYSVILILILVLSGCESKKTDMNILKLGCGNFSDSLDPSASPNSAWGPARYGIAEGLFKFDDKMNAVPNLSDRYEVDETRTVWEFHIREGIEFSNGKKLTASEVVKSLNYLFDQEKNNIGTNKPSQFIQLKSLSSDDKTNTVTIITLKPYADLPKALSHVNYIIVDVESELATKPVGTGPYKVKEINVGVSILLEKNEKYWNGKVPFDKLQVVFMEDSTTKSLALQAGDVDIVDSITTIHDLKTLKESKDFNVFEAPSARTAFSYINHTRILSNDVLREAILLSIDDDTIANITVGGVYLSEYSLLPSTLDYGFEKLKDKTPYNLELAKEKLDKEGIVDTDGDGIREIDGKNIILKYVSYGIKSLDVISEAVAVNLKELGIGVDLKIYDVDTHWNMVASGEYDLAICSWITVPAGDPIGYLENWYSKGKSNHNGFKNKKYDDLYEQLLIEVDKNNQKEIVIKLQQILIDNMAAMVHGVYKSSLSSTKKIDGVKLPISETSWITTEIKPAKN